MIAIVKLGWELCVGTSLSCTVEIIIMGRVQYATSLHSKHTSAVGRTQVSSDATPAGRL